MCTPLSDRYPLEPKNSTFPTGFGWVHFDIDDCNHVGDFESIYEENIARYGKYMLTVKFKIYSEFPLQLWIFSKKL